MDNLQSPEYLFRENPLEMQLRDAFDPLLKYFADRNKGESSYQAVYGLLALLGHRTLEISTPERIPFVDKVIEELKAGNPDKKINVLLLGTATPKTIREFAREIKTLQEKHNTTINASVLDLMTTSFVRNKAIAQQEGITLREIKASAFELPLAANSFDLVVNDTLLNMFDGEGINMFAKEIQRILRPNGAAFFVYETGTIIDRFSPGGNVENLAQVEATFRGVGLELETVKTSRTPLHITSRPVAFRIRK